MSRIGKMPIVIPEGVTVAIDGQSVSVKGPKGSLNSKFDGYMNITCEDKLIVVKRKDDTKKSKSLHGLTRSLIYNMVKGVVDGFEKKLEINGVGYRAQKQGKNLVMNLGFSHQVIIPEPDDISLAVVGQNVVVVSGIDKQKVGQVAAQIRDKRPPEPYKGKGIKYDYEHIVRKAGKAGKGTKG